jgi:hypothetical protein
MLRFIRRLLHFPGRALLAALVITGTLLASPVSAGLRRDAPHSEDAIEAHHITLSVNGQGRGELIAYPCADCPPRTLKMTGPVKVWVQGRPDPLVDFRSLDGKEATVIFDITTLQVLRLVR